MDEDPLVLRIKELEAGCERLAELYRVSAFQSCFFQAQLLALTHVFLESAHAQTGVSADAIRARIEEKAKAILPTLLEGLEKKDAGFAAWIDLRDPFRDAD